MPYRKTVIAPSSSPMAATSVRWSQMRCSSEVTTRRYFARSGASSLQSFSTVSAKPTLFMIDET